MKGGEGGVSDRGDVGVAKHRLSVELGSIDGEESRRISWGRGDMNSSKKNRGWGGWLHGN